MWQNTSYEEIAGIKGRVDGDIAFYDYPKIIKDKGLNEEKEESEPVKYKKEKMCLYLDLSMKIKKRHMK